MMMNGGRVLQYQIPEREVRAAAVANWNFHLTWCEVVVVVVVVVREVATAKTNSAAEASWCAQNRRGVSECDCIH